MTSLSDQKYIKIAETKLGFEKCTPYIQWGDGSYRWLKGGGLWEEYFVVSFAKHKMSMDKTL